MATLSTTVIQNMALSLLGVAPILVSDTTSKEAKVMNLWFDPSRDEVIRSATWVFARDRTALARLSETPEFNWDYQYQLPVNPKCLRVLRLIEDLGYLDYLSTDYLYTGEGSAYVIEGDRLLTNYETANILYLKRVTDPTKFDSMFVKALAYKIASEACFDITGSLDKQPQLDRKYEHLLNVASGMSNIEHHRTPDKNNAWTGAGRGGVIDDVVLDRRLGG